jgi:stearoyl-CoA desaturase (delta-9 desaturase)
MPISYLKKKIELDNDSNIKGLSPELHWFFLLTLYFDQNVEYDCTPRPPMPIGAMPPLFDDKVTLNNWHKHVNWIHLTLLAGTPLIGLYGALTTELQTKTLIWSIIYYYITGIGITAGYHRYWAHRAYRATRLFQVILCLAGSGAVEGSIQWWSRGHRAHHRYALTENLIPNR